MANTVQTHVLQDRAVSQDRRAQAVTGYGYCVDSRAADRRAKGGQISSQWTPAAGISLSFQFNGSGA